MLVPEARRASEMKELSLSCNTLPVDRVLGVHRDAETDTFSYYS